MNTPTIAHPSGLKRSLPLTWGPSLFDWLVPGADTRHRIAASIAFIALIVVCSKIRFYLPDNPTPITLQTLAILTAGGVMGFRWGLVSVFGYLVIGALGFLTFANQPFSTQPSVFTSLADVWVYITGMFTSPADGWTYVTGVTGGYLLGFLLATAVVGALSQYGFDRSNSLWANALGGIAVYIPAIIWLAVGDFGWPADGKLLMDGMYIYLPGDFLKVIAASVLVTGLWKFADNLRSGREPRDV